MKQTEMNVDELKTIESMLNKKAPKSSMKEKTKLILITGGILTAIAAPITVAAVLITKTNSDKESAQQKYDNSLKLHQSEISSIMNSLTNIAESNALLQKLKNTLLQINKFYLNQTPEIQLLIADSFDAIIDRERYLKEESERLHAELSVLHRVIASAKELTSNVFDIYFN